MSYFCMTVKNLKIGLNILGFGLLCLGLVVFGLTMEAQYIDDDNHNVACYAVADNGVNDGPDQLVRIFQNEIVVIGDYTGTQGIEGMAINRATGEVYAADAGRLGRLNLQTGLFSFVANFGSGRGSIGDRQFRDVDALVIDSETNILFGVNKISETREHLLFQFDLNTNQLIRDAYGPGADYVVVRHQGVSQGVNDLTWYQGDLIGVGYYNNMANNGSNKVYRIFNLNRYTGEVSESYNTEIRDIEAINTDPFGQLYGIVSAQGFSHADTIFKMTRFGQIDLNSSRSITVGFDYEAVVCIEYYPTDDSSSSSEDSNFSSSTSEQSSVSSVDSSDSSEDSEDSEDSDLSDSNNSSSEISLSSDNSIQSSLSSDYSSSFSNSDSSNSSQLNQNTDNNSSSSNDSGNFNFSQYIPEDYTPTIIQNSYPGHPNFKQLNNQDFSENNTNIIDDNEAIITQNISELNSNSTENTPSSLTLIRTGGQNSFITRLAISMILVLFGISLLLINMRISEESMRYTKINF